MLYFYNKHVYITTYHMCIRVHTTWAHVNYINFQNYIFNLVNNIHFMIQEILIKRN